MDEHKKNNTGQYSITIHIHKMNKNAAIGFKKIKKI